MHAVLFALKGDRRDHNRSNFQRAISSHHIDWLLGHLDIHPVPDHQDHQRLVELPFLRLIGAFAITEPRDLRERNLRHLPAAELKIDRLLGERSADHLAFGADDKLARAELADVDQPDDLFRRQVDVAEKRFELVRFFLKRSEERIPTAQLDHVEHRASEDLAVADVIRVHPEIHNRAANIRRKIAGDLRELGGVDHLSAFVGRGGDRVQMHDRDGLPGGDFHRHHVLHHVVALLPLYVSYGGRAFSREHLDRGSAAHGLADPRQIGAGFFRIIDRLPHLHATIQRHRVLQIDRHISAAGVLEDIDTTDQIIVASHLDPPGDLYAVDRLK